MNGFLTIDDFKVPIGNYENNTIIIGSDHRGFDYKQAILEKFKGPYRMLDVGTFSAERCDYPGISSKIAKNMVGDDRAVGIGICGSGIGILIPASKYPGIFAGRCLSPEEAETSRKHNNTNLLGLGADLIDVGTALETVERWLKTPFYSDPERDEAYMKRYLQTLKLQADTSKYYRH